MLGAALGMLALVAWVIIVLPERASVSAKLRWGVACGSVGLAVAGYALLGDYLGVQQYQQLQLTQHLLQKVGSWDKVAEKMRHQLQVTPKDAKGWYLLGRVHLLRKDAAHAKQAFAKAYQLGNRSPELLFAYAKVLRVQQGDVTPKVHALLQQLLGAQPNHAGALLMLAEAAYSHRQYKKAIDYWQQLLQGRELSAETRRSIRQAIAKAKAATRHPTR